MSDECLFSGKYFMKVQDEDEGTFKCLFDVEKHIFIHL